MIGPIFEGHATSGEYANVKFFKVDVDENAEAAQAAGIQAMPTFKFYKGGAVVDEMKGADVEGLKTKLAALNAWFI